MSWWDYIPVVGSVGRLAKGDYKQAGIDALGPIGPGAQDLGFGDHLDFFGWDEKNQGYTNAQKQLEDLANQQRNFQMQGLDKAESYYQPAQDRLNALYGPPGAFKK